MSRRYPDFSGSWKVVSSRGEALFRKLGLPEQMIKVRMKVFKAKVSL